MDKEEIKIKEFDKEQLELLLKDLQDIDKFTGFKDGAFKYELGKYQASLLVNCIKKQKEVIDKLKDKTKENIKNAKYEITTLTIGDKAYYQYIKKILDNYVDILKEVSE